HLHAHTSLQTIGFATVKITRELRRSREEVCSPRKEKKLVSDSHTATARLRRIEGKHNCLVKELRQAFDRGEVTESGGCAGGGARAVAGDRWRSGSGEPRNNSALGRGIRRARCPSRRRNGERIQQQGSAGLGGIGVSVNDGQDSNVRCDWSNSSAGVPVGGDVF